MRKLGVKTLALLLAVVLVLGAMPAAVAESAQAETYIGIYVSAKPKELYIEGQLFDDTFMEVSAFTANYETETKLAREDWDYEPKGELKTSDTYVTITCEKLGFTCKYYFDVIPDTVSELEIVTPPKKTSYNEGEYFDATGMTVRATRLSGKTEMLIDGTKSSSAGYMYSTKQLTPEDAEFEIWYTDHMNKTTTTVKLSIKALPFTLSSISITTPPKKTEYVEGEVFNPEGMVVTAHYSTNRNVVVTDYTYSKSELTMGTSYIMISYTLAGITRTATTPIKVVEKQLSEITIAQKPDKTEYYVDDVFNPYNMKVVAKYTNGKESTILDYTYSKDMLLATDTKVTISYTYKNVTKTADVDITVKDVRVRSIVITELPIKLTYIEGERFNATGLKVIANYTDNTTADVTDKVTYTLEPLKLTDTSLTVSYKFIATTVTVELKLTEIKERVLDSISLTANPTTTTYTEKQLFSTAGMKITATFNGTLTESITDYTYSPAGALTIDDKKVVVSYTYKNVTKTVDIPITVKPIVFELSVSPNLAVTFTVDGGKSDAIYVYSHSDWTVTSSADWLTVSPAKGAHQESFVLTAAKNTGDAREATVTIANGYDKDLVLKVVQDEYIKPIKGLKLNVSAITIAKGQTVSSVKAVIEYEKAQVEYVILWESSDTSIATVDANGVIKGVKVGTATITAKIKGDETKTATLKVTVLKKNRGVTEIKLNKKTTTLEIGKKQTLTATLKPSGAKDKTVTWTSSDTSIAKVNQKGKVTAVAKGVATITATSSSGISAECIVTVIDPYVTSITFSKSSYKIKATKAELGKTLQLVATVLPAAANQKLTWKSSDKSVATVDENGLVTSVGFGKTTITAKATDGSGIKKKITVTVVKK